MFQKNIGAEKALQKIKQFCAYQERNHQEVKDKLYSYGLYKKDVETIMAQLIEENFLNEERFAIAFAGGKFRINKWGRIKIKYELKQKAVSDYCIRIALRSIDESDYIKTIQQLINDKSTSLRQEKNLFIKKQKILRYLTQKGFESTLVNDFIKED